VTNFMNPTGAIYQVLTALGIYAPDVREVVLSCNAQGSQVEVDGVVHRVENTRKFAAALCGALGLEADRLISVRVTLGDQGTIAREKLLFGPKDYEVVAVAIEGTEFAR
jgi:hypothetical protein